MLLINNHRTLQNLWLLEQPQGLEQDYLNERGQQDGIPAAIHLKNTGLVESQFIIFSIIGVYSVQHI